MSVKISGLAAALDTNLTSAAVFPITDGAGNTVKGSLSQLRGALAFLDGVINVKSPAYGAVGDGITDDTTALQLALTAAIGKVLYLPVGTYLVSSIGTECLLAQGSIGGIVGDGWQSKIVVKSTVGSSTDALRIVGTGSGGLVLRDFTITPQSGTPGRYGINFDVTSNYISDVSMQHVQVQQLGSYGVQCTNPVPNANGLFTTSITECVIQGGINLAKAGDSVRICRNTITGSRGVIVDLVTGTDGGAHLFEFADNNVTAAGGLQIKNATTFRILRNNMEQPLASTEANTALIDIDGTVSTVIENGLIQGNYLGATTGNCLSTVRINYAKGIVCRENYSVSPGALATYAAYRITANAIATRLVDEHVAPFGVLIGSVVEDLGTGTSIEYTSPAGHNPRVKGGGITKILHEIYQAGSAQSTNPLLELLANDGTTNVAKVTTSGLVLGAAGTNVSQVRMYAPTLTPTAVAAAGMNEQTFTVTGLATTDRVVVSPPAPANAANMTAARVSAANTIALTFVNPTAGSLTPASGAYQITAFSV